MNFIEEIRSIVRDVAKFAFWDNEMAVYIGEDEIPITAIIDRENNSHDIYLDIEGYDLKLKMRDLGNVFLVMKCLYKHIDEIKKMTEAK